MTRSGLAGIALLGLALGLCAARIVAWHWPSEVAGAVGEAIVLAAATAIGGGGGAALQRGAILARRPARSLLLASWLPAALACGSYALALAIDLRWTGEGFARGGPPRTYLWAAEGCGFVVRFPARPETSAVSAEGAEARPGAIARRASYADVGAATAYVAECLAFARPADPGEQEALRRDAERQLALTAQQRGLRDAAIRRDVRDPLVVALSGWTEGRTEANQPIRRQAEARTHVGLTSILSLTVSVLGSDGGALPAAAAAFLASARPR